MRKRVGGLQALAKKGAKKESMTKTPLTTAAEINRKNREYWDKRNAEIQQELEKAKNRPTDIEQAFVPTTPAEIVSGIVDPLEKLKTTRLVRQGERFAPKGRGKSTIRKRIETLIKKHPDIKNKELWESITYKLPATWEVYNAPKFGGHPYLVSPDNVTTQYPRFCVIASQVRKEQKES